MTRTRAPLSRQRPPGSFRLGPRTLRRAPMVGQIGQVIGVGTAQPVTGGTTVDDFERPDQTGGLGGTKPWLYEGTSGNASDWGVTNGAAYNPGGGADKSAAIDTGSAHHWAEFTYGGKGAGAADLGIDIRRVDNNNRIWVDTFGDVIRLIKVVAGSLTVINSNLGSVSVDTVIRAEAVGDQLRIKRNGTTVYAAAIDAGLLTGTKVAMSSHTGNSSYRWKKFSWGLLTVPTASAKAVYVGGSSQFVSWPSGTVEADLVIIQYESGWNVVVPSGWTNRYYLSGTNGSGEVVCKYMTEDDIAAGGVTLTTTGGSFPGHANVIRVPGLGEDRARSVENTSQTGLLTIADSPSSTEQVVDLCDIDLDTPDSVVLLDVDFWWSMSEGGGGKFVTWRVRRDNLSGAVLGSGTAGAGVDSTAGHDVHVVAQATDSDVTNGRYVLTVQCTGGFTSPIYSDSRVFRATTGRPILSSIAGVYTGSGFTSKQVTAAEQVRVGDKAYYAVAQRVNAIQFSNRGTPVGQVNGSNASGGVWVEEFTTPTTPTVTFTSGSTGANDLAQVLVTRPCVPNPSYVPISTPGFRTSASSAWTVPTHTIPATVAVGELLIGAYFCNDSSPETPTGFDALRTVSCTDGQFGDTRYLHVYSRKVQAGDAGSVVSLPVGGENYSGAILGVYGNVDQTTPVASHAAMTGDPPLAASVTPPKAGMRRVYVLVGFQNNGGAVYDFGAPAGVSQRREDLGDTHFSIALFDERLLTTAPTAARQFTCTRGTTTGVAVMVNGA